MARSARVIFALDNPSKIWIKLNFISFSRDVQEMTSDRREKSNIKFSKISSFDGTKTKFQKIPVKLDHYLRASIVSFIFIFSFVIEKNNKHFSKIKI